MDIERFMDKNGEQPLDTIVGNGGFCGILGSIGCIGDSLSSGEFESMENGECGWHDYYEYSWGQFMARDAGCTVYNLSRGGLSAKTFNDLAKEKGFYSDKYKCRAYIIALGVNDASAILAGEMELGSTADIDTEDYAKNKPTFAGYYAKIISKFKMLQPKAKFFLMTCPKSDESPERSGIYDRHAELLHEIAAVFENCYVLDFRKYAPVHDEKFKKHFYLAGHLNAAGYRLTALMTESYIDYIIRHNTEDFTQIGFVGTPYHNADYKW